MLGLRWYFLNSLAALTNFVVWLCTPDLLNDSRGKNSGAKLRDLADHTIIETSHWYSSILSDLLDFYLCSINLTYDVLPTNTSRHI